MSLVDEQVGRVLATVDELGLTDDAAVLFTAGHGEFTGSDRLHEKGPAMYEVGAKSYDAALSQLDDQAKG